MLISAVVADTVSRAREPTLGVGNYGLNMTRRSFQIALYGRQNLIPLLAICGNLSFFFIWPLWRSFCIPLDLLCEFLLCLQRFSRLIFRRQHRQDPQRHLMQRHLMQRHLSDIVGRDFGNLTRRHCPSEIPGHLCEVEALFIG